MITVILGADHKYRDFARYAVMKAEALGYNVICYDLGGLGFGVPFEVPPDTLVHKKGVLPKTLYKMDIMTHALREHDKVLFVDTDAFIERPIDEAFEDEFDIGVTFRPNNDGLKLIAAHPRRMRSRMIGYINAGVIFAKQTPAAFKFIEAWKKEAYLIDCDQGGLNEVIVPHTKWDLEKEEEPPMYVDTPWAKVRVFSMEEYNYTVSRLETTSPKAFPPKPLPGVNPKILHWKNDKYGLAALVEKELG